MTRREKFFEDYRTFRLIHGYGRLRSAWAAARNPQFPKWEDFKARS